MFIFNLILYINKLSYLTYSFNLTENQKNKLANAYNNKKAVNIKFKFNQLMGDFPITIT